MLSNLTVLYDRMVPFQNVPSACNFPYGRTLTLQLMSAWLLIGSMQVILPPLPVTRSLQETG